MMESWSQSEIQNGVQNGIQGEALNGALNGILNETLNGSENGSENADRSIDIVLSVEGISKKFCRSLKRSLFYGIQDMGAELLGLRREADTLRYNEFWALNQVHFELRRGEAIGLIGANGSGKTTLLRIISGLIKPDRGIVRVRGRVAPLIALGAGFSPILTGRENIYANLSILGLSRSEIDQRFEDVVAFAEINEAIDAPVQSYSSGMAARLGFACAVHTDPDILLIDEVLAVGDMKFLAKCHRRLHQLQQNGTAFVLVSHNPQAILAMCPQAVYLQKGRVIATGATETVMAKYEEDLFLGDSPPATTGLQRSPKPANQSTGLDILSLYFRDRNGNLLENLTSGESVRLCIRLFAHRNIQDFNARISITELGKEGQPAIYFGGTNDKEFYQLQPGLHELQIELPYLGLAPGLYLLRADVRSEALYILDIADSFRFTVQSNGRMSKSSFYQPRRWRLLSKSNLTDPSADPSVEESTEKRVEASAETTAEVIHNPGDGEKNLRISFTAYSGKNLATNLGSEEEPYSNFRGRQAHEFSI